MIQEFYIINKVIIWFIVKILLAYLINRNSINTIMKISIVNGSVRKGRQSHKVAGYVESTLNNRNIACDLIDLAQAPLPIMGFEPDQTTGTDEQINDISNRLAESDAVILVTPEYHGSFSGVLKNALDHFTPEFVKKPVGVVAASAGKMAGINASTQLQHVILSLGAYPVPQKLLVPEVHNALDDSIEPQNEVIRKSTNRFLDEFIWFAEAIVQKKVQEEAV